MAKVVIDGKEYEVNPDNNLLQECLSQGLDLPYFCWHPCMGSVGACRQCAVKQYRDEDDKEGMLVMACMTPASDGTRISIEDEQAKDMRERVIESLMISHPHDCPVCEEGGECHLQDMTLMSGHNYRRYDKQKRTHHNQYLGPFINHEMNRCIACYRCVRYYDDYAGGTDLAAQASHHHVYFGRHEEGVLESEFSGNLVEVCPTGVFTDKAFSEHYTRKWDLQTAPSVCVGCSVGCNTTPGERYGSLRRITNRYNSEVNGYFLCDRGRFGFDYVNSDERLSAAVAQADGGSTELENEQVADLLAELKSDGAIGIGSPRASNEANYALRNLVGEENFYAGVADDEHAVGQLILKLSRDSAFHTPSIRDIEQADAALVVGEDLTNTAARVALALRQSVRNKAAELATNNNIPVWQDAAVRELAQHERSPLSILSAHATRLDDVASEVVIEGYAQQAAIANAVAAKLSSNAPAVSGLDAELQAQVDAIADHLANAKRPLVVSGSSNGQVELVKAAANVARALHEKNASPIDLCLVQREVNSFGLQMLVAADNNLGAALDKLSSGAVEKAIVLENDLYRRAAHAAVDSALDKLDTLVVLDLLPTRTTAKATHVLPTTAFSEHEATYINYEGRAQLSYQVHRCANGAVPAWQWLHGSDVSAIVKECSEEAAGFDKLDELLPRLDQFVAGMKVPRQSHRYSGRTAMIANLNVHEPKQPQDPNSVMSFSMEGIPALNDASVLGAAWSPSWNSNQSISKFQDEINGELKQGHTGNLLIERNENGAYLSPEPIADSASNGEFTLARSQQIFGSDELSGRATAIQQRTTGSYISLSPEDAKALGVVQGDAVSLNGNGAVATACVRARIKPGTVTLYADETLDVYALPASLALSKSENAADRSIDGLIISDRYEEDY
ncbi:MAG: NADH-quinone oxidoreductase subunit NuoG [Pseudomonadales bacterium]|nr:NADH-quinone oxidoreductase subunit NuoG [Pseudomonadales bacterium]